jgi:ubiquinone/menaquinone biosynthesis C-methylase UbiE
VRRGGIVRRLAPQPGERVLGAGPGAEAVAARIAERLWPAGELALVDVPETAADEAHERGLESVSLVGDASHLPFAEDSFDGAYVTGPTDFAELRRVLRPGARVVVAGRAARAGAASAGLEQVGRSRFTA